MITTSLATNSLMRCRRSFCFARVFCTRGVLFVFGIGSPLRPCYCFHNVTMGIGARFVKQKPLQLAEGGRGGMVKAGATLAINQRSYRTSGKAGRRRRLAYTRPPQWEHWRRGWSGRGWSGRGGGGGGGCFSSKMVRKRMCPEYPPQVVQTDCMGWFPAVYPPAYLEYPDTHFRQPLAGAEPRDTPASCQYRHQDHIVINWPASCPHWQSRQQVTLKRHISVS